MKKYDLVVVGGGIVGLATSLQALKLNPNLKLLVLEKENEIACHQSKHNSGVIHSGLYYKPNSLKAKNCIDGYQKLVKFCEEESIAYDICGKVVIATTIEEIPWLDELYKRGTANGLMGIKILSSAEIKEREPHCSGLKGLYVPQTGIVDYVLVAQKYAEKIIALGGEIQCQSEVKTINNAGGTLVKVVTTDNEYACDKVVTCAGLYSDRISKLTEPKLPLQITPFRGEYYKLKESAHSLVNNLIYPVPNPLFPFLGVHFTRLISGGFECGPNAVLAFAREGYKKTSFNLKDTVETIMWPGFRKVALKYWRAGLQEYYRSFSKKAFVKALQNLVPEIQEEHLEVGGAGVRAQACSSDGILLDDFFISHHGRVINVCNAPSPAATSSLSIGRKIAESCLKGV